MINSNKKKQLKNCESYRGFPKYTRIADLFRKKIQTNQLSSGEKLDPITILAKRNNTTIATMSKALELLEKENLLERIHGKGTFIRSKKNQTFAIVFDLQIFEHNTPVHVSFLKEFEALCIKKGYNRKIFINISCPETAGDFLTALKERSFDSLIIASNWVAHNKMDYLKKNGVKCVGLYPYDTLDYWTCANGYQMALLGLQQLRQMERKKIAFMTPKSTMDDTNKQGYIVGLRELGLNIKPRIFEAETFNAHSGYEAFMKLWDAQEKPDGLLVSDESLIQGVIQAVIKLGISVPDDIAIATQVTQGAGSLFAIPLIELRNPINKIISEAIEMLEHLHSGPPVLEPKKQIPPEAYNPFLTIAKHQK